MYYILPIIEDSLVKNSNRGIPVPPVLQLLMVLRFYATGNYQVQKIIIKTRSNEILMKVILNKIIIIRLL